MEYVYILSNLGKYRIEKVKIIRESEKCYYLEKNSVYADIVNKMKLDNEEICSQCIGMYSNEYKANVALHNYLCSEINNKEDELNTLENEKRKVYENILKLRSLNNDI